jgi:hypothetical protein
VAMPIVPVAPNKSTRFGEWTFPPIKGS